MADVSSLTSSTTSADVNDQAKRACVLMWCTPRSTSSIITKCLSAVPDSQIYFEPYYFCYMSIRRLKLMGREVNPKLTSGYDEVTNGEWLKTAQLISGEDCEGRLDFDMMKFPRIKQELEAPHSDRKLIFLKETAYVVDGYYDFLPDASCNYKYVFLLRNPIKVFTSWRKVMFELHKTLLLQDSHAGTPSKKQTNFDSFYMVNDVPEVYTPRGLFFKEIYDLWKYVKDNLDPNPVVIDSDDLLSDPATVLRKFCDATDIPYTEDLLQWEGNPDSTNEWITAFAPLNDFEFIRIYCQTAFHSTHFLPPSPLPSLASLTPDVLQCVESTMPFYQEMYDSHI